MPLCGPLDHSGHGRRTPLLPESITRGKVGRSIVEEGGRQMVMEGELAWGGEHAIQYIDDVL